MHGNWLDIGCGSGALAVEWMRQQRTGLYQGVDFSQDLLSEAQKEIWEVHLPVGLEVKFSTADLISDRWNSPFMKTEWDGALCFAVLHHIPGIDMRQRICTSIRGLLGRQRKLYLSVWQVKNSQRLMRRILPWSQAGINEDELDAGDVLMDWRAVSENESHLTGFRYVHIFTENELGTLAENSGFEVKETFYSDGKEGNLGLYQNWVVK